MSTGNELLTPERLPGDAPRQLPTAERARAEQPGSAEPPLRPLAGSANEVAPAEDSPAPSVRKEVLGLWLAMTVGLAWAGQYTFSRARTGELPFLGVLLLLAAMVLLGSLVLVTSPGLQGTRHARWLEQMIDRLVAASWRAWSGAIAIGACLLATRLGQIPGRGWYALGAWLLSIVAALLAVHSGRSRAFWRTWDRTRWAEAGLVVGCVIVALLLRTIRLESVPPILGGDEGSMGFEAREILSGRNDRLFVTGWLGMPRMSFLLMALPMQVWGQGIVGLRMHAAIVGVATIPVLYWLLRPEGGVWLAQCSIWLLATYPYHLHFSRLGANNIEDSLLLAATFAALFWGVRSRQPMGWALAGLCGAFSLYFYPGAWLLIILAVGLVGVLALCTRGRWVSEPR